MNVEKIDKGIKTIESLVNITKIIFLVIGALLVYFVVKTFGVIAPVLITILGVIYLISPIDILPEALLGPLGVTDDIFVILLIFASWILYFLVPFITIVINVIIIIGVIAIMIYIIKLLTEMVK